MAIGIKSSNEISAEMNTTPLIDVMLVLLVLVILTLPLQTHAVKLAMGIGRPNLPPPPVVNVQVDFDGTMLWNGHVVDRAGLDANLQSAAGQIPQPVIQVSADRLVRYDRVATVLADAQRLGMKDIGFVNANRY